MDPTNPTVTNFAKHAKSDSVATSKSERSIFSFQTGATARANLNTTSSEENTLADNETDADGQYTAPTVNDAAKTSRPWKKFHTIMRRRNTVRPTSDEESSPNLEIPATSSSSNLQIQSPQITPSLPELPQRKSLVQELDVFPQPDMKESTQPTSPLSQTADDSMATNQSLRLVVPQQPKVCTKCGKRKRPKLVVKQQSAPQSMSKPRAALAVIAENPVEQPPLLSPTNVSDTSTLCAPESASDDNNVLQKSRIYSIDIASDFDTKYLVPDEVKFIPPRSGSGLSFMNKPLGSLHEESDTSYALDEDELGEEATPRNSLSVPDTAALDKILRDMQDLLERTNARTYSTSAFDLRASPLPREIV